MNTEPDPWRRFNNSLFQLKIRQATRLLREKADAGKRRVGYDFRKSRNVNQFALEYCLQDCDLQILREWAALYDSLAHDVWGVQGHVVTPGFVRMIFDRLILPLLAARQGSIKAEFELRAARTRMNPSLSIRVLKRLQTKVRELRQELSEECAIKAKTLEIQSALGPPSATATSTARQTKIPITPPESISQSRARTVAKVIDELNILRPLIYGNKEYLDLRPQFAEFVTFEVAENHPALKGKLLHIQAHSRRHYRFAQEIAAAYYGRTLATIQTDWKHFKPVEFKAKRHLKNTRSKAC